MASTDKLRQKIKSKVSAIKKINDNAKLLTGNVSDNFKDDLPSTDGVVKKSINNFTSKLKGGSQNKKDIFGEVIDTVEGFLGTNQKDEKTFDKKEKPIIKRRIMKYSKDSAHITLQSSKQVIIDEIKKTFFGGVGMCDPNNTLRLTSMNISPKSFDFINVLKIDPDSISGKMMYENIHESTLNGIKFNRELYNNFDSGVPYAFTSKSGSTLFSMTWNSTTQKYAISGLSSSMKIGDFLNDYYNSIEYPSVDHVVKNAMLMTLQGDGSEPSSFKDGMNYLNRLTTKLFSICGTPSTNQPLLNNAVNELNDDEYDISNYFDFDDVEGIDLDDEDAKKRRVLKFTDCDNFEIPINSNHMEDFAYMLDKKTLDENINNTLNKVSNDAAEQTSGSISFDLLQLSLMGSYILKIPKALIGTILSPKLIFPIALTYNSITNQLLSVKDLMKILSKLFFNIIKTLFWKFIKQFWSFIKKDLLIFLKETANAILSDKLKKIKDIITSLIGFLRQAISSGNIQSCTEIFNTILKTIDLVMNKNINIPIPGLLLLMSKKLPGFSSNKVFMDMMEKAESSGINTGPIYGTDNKLPSLFKAISDSVGKGLQDVQVRAVLEGGVIPVGPGGGVIVPGTQLVTGLLI